MKKLLTIALFLLASTLLQAQKTDNRCFELRIYYCNPGKLNNLIERFAQHTTRLFEKHGMENIGYWLPADNKDSALYYVLAFPSKAARDSSWKAFGNDPVWNEVRTRSEANGKLLTKITSIFMNATDYSSSIKSSRKKTDRLFELRTYTAAPGKLADLNTRFREHTRKLVAAHSITNIAYWNTLPADSSQPQLVYIVAHTNMETARQAWIAFDKDPVWLSAKEASEKNGKLVEKIETVFLRPLPFSRIR